LTANELKEVNIIFDLIDVNGDGHWNTTEILSTDKGQQAGGEGPGGNRPRERGE
jgi:hypothetical protein